MGPRGHGVHRGHPHVAAAGARARVVACARVCQHHDGGRAQLEKLGTRGHIDSFFGMVTAGIGRAECYHSRHAWMKYVDGCELTYAGEGVFSRGLVERSCSARRSRVQVVFTCTTRHYFRALTPARL